MDAYQTHRGYMGCYRRSMDLHSRGWLFHGLKAQFYWSCAKNQLIYSKHDRFASMIAIRLSQMWAVHYIPMLDTFPCWRCSTVAGVLPLTVRWVVERTPLYIFSCIQVSIHSSTLSVNSDTRSTLIPSKFDSVSRNLGRSQQRQDAVTKSKATMYWREPYFTVWWTTPWCHFLSIFLFTWHPH